MDNPLWTLAEAIDATGAALEGDAPGNRGLTGVSIDSRTLRPEEIFVAIRGDNRDGHEFVGTQCPAIDRDGANHWC